MDHLAQCSLYLTDYSKQSLSLQAKKAVRMLPLVFHTSQYFFRPITVPFPVVLFSTLKTHLLVADVICVEYMSVLISDITLLLFHINFFFP